MDESHQNLEKMKEVMSTCHVLSLPYFSWPFFLECDASGVGTGSFFMQRGHPIVFERRNLNDSERLYSIYDKEIIAIMHALTKFRKYLVGRWFVVKTDHNSIKYFLDQKDLSERQQKWFSKIQNFEFGIEYVKGKKECRSRFLVQEANKVFDDGYLHRLEGTFVDGVIQKQIFLRGTGWIGS
jgi:hypothetical protein